MPALLARIPPELRPVAQELMRRAEASKGRPEASKGRPEASKGRPAASKGRAPAATASTEVTDAFGDDSEVSGVLRRFSNREDIRKGLLEDREEGPAPKAPDVRLADIPAYRNIGVGRLPENWVMWAAYFQEWMEANWLPEYGSETEGVLPENEVGLGVDRKNSRRRRRQFTLVT